MTMPPMEHCRFHIVIAGLDPAIHALAGPGKKDVDARAFTAPKWFRPRRRAFAAPKRLRPRRRVTPAHDE
jgi:hypothetical protein